MITMTNKICKMCGSDNTQTYYDFQKKEMITECEDCKYWEIEYDEKIDETKIKTMVKKKC